MPATKYASRRSYWKASLKRRVLRSAIRGLARWHPLGESRSGYTVIVSAAAPLAPLVETNLRFVAGQDLTGLAEVIILLDIPGNVAVATIEDRLRHRFPTLPLRFAYFDRLQAGVSRLIDWAWVYNWLCWCNGIAQSNTRYVLLHDLDALVVKPDFFRERYERMLDSDVQYLGCHYYENGAIERDDGLVPTLELMIDAGFIRSRFSPIDIFNRIGRHRGRIIDFDLFQFAQSVAGRVDVAPLGEDDLVHPGQMVSQFTSYVGGRTDRIPQNRHNLMMIPYYFFLADEPDVLLRLKESLSRTESTAIDFFGGTVDVSLLLRHHIATCERQITRAEHALFGETRPEVREYVAALKGAAGHA